VILKEAVNDEYEPPETRDRKGSPAAFFVWSF